MNRRPLIVANWKMQLTLAGAVALATSLRRQFDIISRDRAEILLAPAFPHLAPINKLLAGSAIGLAAQDVFWEERGPFTGEVSGVMLAELGVNSVIVGHSERRQVGDTDEIVRKKFHAALSAGLHPLLCVGETREERGSGRAELAVSQQIKYVLEAGSPLNRPFVIAYEPVWAIHPGGPALPSDAQIMGRVVGQTLIDILTPGEREQARIIYGGSLDAQNAAAYVDGRIFTGVLVGSASLEADEFTALVEHLSK